MAVFRKVHVKIWQDSFIASLTPEQKFFFLYLLTNNNTTQCGIYEITIHQIAFDTGYNEETIKKLLSFFITSDKVYYSDTTKEIAIKNWIKYNGSTSPKVKACIAKELKLVKDTVCIQYVYTMHTHAQEEEEEEEEEKKQASTPESDFRRLNGPGKDIYEMFRRLLDRVKFSDSRVITEVLKFQNKYPENMAKNSGALVNTWCSNIREYKPTTQGQVINQVTKQNVYT